MGRILILITDLIAGAFQVVAYLVGAVVLVVFGLFAYGCGKAMLASPPSPEEQVCSEFADWLGAATTPDATGISAMRSYTIGSTLNDYAGDDQDLADASRAAAHNQTMPDGTSSQMALWRRCEALGFDMIDMALEASGSAMDRNLLMAGLEGQSQSGSSPPSTDQGGDIDCSAVDGPFALTGPDPNGLDADGDGLACE